MQITENKPKKRAAKYAVMVVLDILIVLLAAWGAYLLILLGNGENVMLGVPVLLWGIANAVLAVTLFALSGLYVMSFSTVGMPEIMRILFCSATLGILNILFVIVFELIDSTLRIESHITCSLMIIYIVFFMCGIGAFRFSKRAVLALQRHWTKNRSEHQKRVAIVGFNDNTFALLRNMLAKEDGQYRPICVLDAEEKNVGQHIYDIRVVGTTSEIGYFTKRYNIDEIFVTIPPAQKGLLRETLEYCKECGCQIKMLSDLNKLTNGELSVAKMRNVEIADLLGREQKQVNLDEIMGYIEHKKVMVTGGGGSIGSELCRQIVLHNPAQLIILDIYENNAYDIEQELKEKYPELDLVTLIASIRDKNKIEKVFETYRPQIVFNAAAHKHVPLMETSPNEAVKNNVFGTLNVAKAAAAHGVEVFVQISTDKAVNPTNIMGATKRICEMIIQTIGRHSETTKFVAVRFGNVLGSNGSVIPLFKKQIERGGPVTVTHKDIIRYFMTIPEAVSLVLQAGAYAKNGQIFVLDMGEPVRIYDLAYNLIKLSGLEPNIDIEIRCTGLRPGEKLYEERLMAEEGLTKTPNGLISIAKPLAIDEENFWTVLDELYEAAYSETDKMKEWVKKLVPTYTIDKRAQMKELLENSAGEEKEIAATTA